jgi:hypothetical protein
LQRYWVQHKALQRYWMMMQEAEVAGVVARKRGGKMELVSRTVGVWEEEEEEEAEEEEKRGCSGHLHLFSGPSKNKVRQKGGREGL